jgi:hypothetical protein
VRWVVRYPKIVALTSGGVLLFLSFASDARGQTKEELRKAFRNLRNDHVRYNCSRAAYWLYQHREALHDQILEELYATKDAQARDVLLDLLFVTKGFVPDERFARFVVGRLREEGTRVRSDWCVIPARDVPDDLYPDAFNDGAHHRAFGFMNAHYSLFEPLLKAEINDSDDTWEIWSIAALMNARRELAGNAALFTPEVLRKVGRSLKNDHVDYNASEAARLFLLLGKQTLPVLSELSKSHDAQQASLARALVDYIGKGKKDGLGFVNTTCYTDAETYSGFAGSMLVCFFGPNGLTTKFLKENEEEPPEPGWIAEYTKKYDGVEKYP